MPKKSNIARQGSDRIRHKRWRHVEHDYVVTVLETLNYGHGKVRCTILVDRTRYSKRPRLWTEEAFLVAFKPVGRPQKEQTLWDLL